MELAKRLGYLFRSTKKDSSLKVKDKESKVDLKKDKEDAKRG